MIKWGDVVHNFIGEFWYIFLVFLFVFNLLFGVFVVFFEKKNPGVIWAWLMVLAFIPCLGFIIYLIFGFEGRKHKWFEKKGQEDRAICSEFQYKFPELANNNIPENFNERILPIEHTWYLNNFVVMNYNSCGSIYRKNNEVSVFHEGNSKFKALVEDIKNAKKYVYMEYYLMHDDRLGNIIMDLLVEKAKAGIEVKVLYDGMGNVKNRPNFRKKLILAGGEARVFLPPRGIRINYRNHRKIAVIDGKIGYVGGLNIGDEYIGGKKRFGFWRDSHIRIEGSAVYDLQLRFIMDWNFTKGEKMKLDERHFPEIISSDGNVNMQIVSSGPDTSWDSIYFGYFRLVTEANRNIYIESPYFAPDDGLLEALKTAAISGVDVRIIIPAKPDHLFVHSCSLNYMGELLEAGVRCYEYTKGFIHSKVMTIDGIVTSVGTANMDIRSYKLNFEVNAFIYNEKVTQEFDRQFELDFKDCREITMESYKKRGIIRRTQESFARLISPLL